MNLRRLAHKYEYLDCQEGESTQLGGRFEIYVPVVEPNVGMASSSEKGNIRRVAGVVCVTLAFSSATLVSLEGYNAVDALYLSCATLSTAGYGDIAPISRSGRVFIAIFGLMGIRLFSNLAAKLGQWQKDKFCGVMRKFQVL